MGVVILAVVFLSASHLCTAGGAAENGKRDEVQQVVVAESAPGTQAERPGSNKDDEKRASQTQRQAGARPFLDSTDYYAVATAPRFAVTDTAYSFLESLYEPVQDSWHRSIMMEARRYGPDARQEYCFYSTGQSPGRRRK